LEENELFANRVYSIEVKKDNEEFEEFNPDLIKVQVVLWKNEYLGLEEKDFKPDNFKIDRTKPLKELKDKIFNFYNLHNQNLYIFKKMEFNQNSYTITEIMENNDEKELQKSIINSAIFEGTKIFIEIKQENWESNFVKVSILLINTSDF